MTRQAPRFRADTGDTLDEDIAQLYRDTSDELRRLLVYKLGNRQEAEEVAHDAYHKLWRIRHEQGTDVRDLRKYLFTMSVRLALNVLRKRRTERNYLIKEQAGDEPDPADDVSLYRELLAEQKLDAVRVALSELPEKSRYIFLLHRFEGLTYSQIAKKLELSGKTVEYHMKQALDKIMAAVEQYAVLES